MVTVCLESSLTLVTAISRWEILAVVELVISLSLVWKFAWYAQLILGIQGFLQWNVAVPVASGRQETLLLFWLSPERTLVDFDRLQDCFVGSSSLELAQSFIEYACQSQRAIWLLQVILIPIMEYPTNIAIFQRRSFQYWWEFAVDSHKLLAFVQLLPKLLDLKLLRSH